MMNEQVKKAYEDNVWFIATCGEDGPHAVPVGFKCVTEDGKLAFAVCALNKTVENIQANGQVAIAVNAGAENYEIKGTVDFVTEGVVYEAFANMSEQAFKGAAPVKCAAIVTPVKGSCFGIATWTKQELCF